MDTNGPNRDVSDARKLAYYGGIAVTLLGVLLFLSNFFGGISEARAIGGMVLIVIGQVVAKLGSHGLAGSGVILDPQQARKDIEPWSRMTGGTIKDALGEVGIDPSKFAADDEDGGLTFDEKLRRLHSLHEDGILDTAEYERAKQAILDQA